MANDLSIKSFEILNYNLLNDFIKKYEPDIIFLAQFSLIIKSDLIKNYTKKIVNLHHSPLPKYRGVSPITHAILNNETEFASTLHFVDEQVDTGEIISQRFFSIIDKTNEDVYSECIKKDDELIENFYKDIFYNKQIFSNPQNDLIATYFSKSSINYENAFIEFDRSANQIVQFCRAFFFPSKNLFPKIKIDNKLYRSQSIPIIGERCVNINHGCVKKIDNKFFISSKDRWVIFENLESNL